MYIRGFFAVVSPHVYLTAYVRRRRLAAAVRAIALAVTTAVVTGLLACGVDRLLPLPAAVRVTLLAVAVVTPLVIFARPVSRLARRFDPVAAAVAVERQHAVFAHRLVTVASAGGPTDLRAALERDVTAVMAATGPARVPAGPAARAVAAAAVSVAVAAGLWRWPWLDLPQLARRLAHPTAGLVAVTTTRLTVRPRAAAVVEGRPVTVTAVVTRGSAGPPLLHTSDDGQTWAERPMPPAGGGYAVTVPSVDRDLRFFVTAGDAVSPTYTVRVRRVPAVAAFRVRYDYPASEHRPPATVTTADGHVDAPAGTAVTLDVVSTVPLSAAAVAVGPDRVETTPTADPAVRRAAFTVRRDERLDVHLTGVDGTPGTGPRSARVRVQPADAAGDVPGFEEQQRLYREATAGHRD